MDKYFLIPCLLDGRYSKVFLPYRKDVPESEILKEAELEIIKRGFSDYELLGLGWAEVIC